MAKRKIFITESDLKGLTLLIKSSKNLSPRDSEFLKNLSDELERGTVVPEDQIPPNVITMNSEVCLKDMDSGEELIYKLVYPKAADISKNKISILAPIGTALIGYKIGDVIEWKVPVGTRKLKVKKILYQPEAAGERNP
ncbi:MAG: nucleoside diphosphate kinase regulator [Calditrichaceae bacterium]